MLDLRLVLAVICNDAVLIIGPGLTTDVAALVTYLLVAVGNHILERHEECILGDDGIARVLRDELWRFRLVAAMYIVTVFHKGMTQSLVLFCFLVEAVVVLWLILGHLVQSFLEELHLPDFTLFLLEIVGHLVFLGLKDLATESMVQLSLLLGKLLQLDLFH